MLENEGGLHTKHRAKSFAEIVGNESTIKSLQSMLKKPKKEISHVFLFAGIYGAGKTSFGRILARELGCNMEFDYLEVDAGKDRKVSDADELKKIIRYGATKGEIRVIVIDEIQETHRGNYMGSLLKTLEDGCPSHIYFILCTTNPEKINKGILSRSSKYYLNPLKSDQISILLNRVCRRERVRVKNTIIDEISGSSGGSARNALVLLDQVMKLEDEKDQLEVLKNSTDIIFSSEVQDEDIINLAKALLKRRPWTEVTKIIKELQSDPEKVRIVIFRYCGACLLNMKPSQSKLPFYDMCRLVMESFKTPFYNTATGLHDLVLACDTLCNG